MEFHQLLLLHNRGQCHAPWQSQSTQLHELQGFQDREVTYPVSKELVDKALRSEQDAYEVELFLQTGEWVTKESKEVAGQNYFRSSPVRILVNPSSIKRLFSNQEFEELIQKAFSSELKPTELDAIGKVDNNNILKMDLIE